MCVCVCVCVCETQRERERERDAEEVKTPHLDFQSRIFFRVWSSNVKYEKWRAVSSIEIDMCRRIRNVWILSAWLNMFKLNVLGLWRNMVWSSSEAQEIDKRS